MINILAIPISPIPCFWSWHFIYQADPFLWNSTSLCLISNEWKSGRRNTEWLVRLGHENNASTTLLAGTPAFGAQTSHGESLNTLRLPCCEEAQANGKPYRGAPVFQVKVSINCQALEIRHLLMNLQPNHHVTTSILFPGGPQRISHGDSQSSLCLFLSCCNMNHPPVFLLLLVMLPLPLLSLSF